MDSILEVWRVVLEGLEGTFGVILGVWAAFGRLLALKLVLGDVRVNF